MLCCEEGEMKTMDHLLPIASIETVCFMYKYKCKWTKFEAAYIQVVELSRKFQNEADHQSYSSNVDMGAMKKEKL